MSSTITSAKNPVRKIAAAVGITVASVIALAGPAAAQDVEPDATPMHTCTFAGEAVQTELVTEECVALEKLWHALNGPNWHHRGDWVTATDPCQGWYGIWCDAGHVQMIDFTYFNPGTGGGHLPPEIGDFEELEYLALPWSGLTGAVPAEIAKLDELYVLDLGWNGFTSIPDTLKDLRSIETLFLDANQLKGDITDALSGMPGRDIDVRFSDGQDGNDCLTATSKQLADWLDEVDPGWNECSTAPPECGSGDPVATPSLPVEECRALVAIYEANGGADWVFVNEGAGTTDKANWATTADPCAWFGVVCTNGHVTELYLGQIGMTGQLPDVFDAFTQVTTINLHENLVIENGEVVGGLSGSVPPSLAKLNQVTLLFLHGNLFTGPIPEFDDRFATKPSHTLFLHSNCYAEGTELPDGQFHQSPTEKCN
jgi:hypothetical protein